MRIAAVLLALTLGACTTPTRVGVLDLSTRRYDPAMLQSPALAAVIAADGAAFSRETHVAKDGTVLPYRLLRPGTRGRAPLVLVLHGSGAIGTDNTAQLGAFAKAWAQPDVAGKFPAYVVAPQVPTRSADYAPGADGLLASRPGLSLPAVLDLVETLTRDLPVDRSRIYVVGFSMGGSAALNALLAEPERFAAAVAFAPAPPPRDRAGEVADVPMLLIHGTADDENPIAPDRAWAEAVARAGGRPRFIAYEGMDHRVPADMLVGDDGWRTWLFSQRR